MPSNNGYQPLISSNQPTTSSPSQKPQFIDDICADGKTPPPLIKIGDKVVWISDNGPEYGLVKWLGKLPNVGDDWMAGVDFFNPIGSGTGVYNEYKLFQTDLNHASLVPIVGLIRACDYEGINTNTTTNNNSKSISNTIENLIPPLKPKRTKKLESSKFYIDSNNTKNNTNNNLSSSLSNNEINITNHCDNNNKIITTTTTTAASTTLSNCYNHDNKITKISNNLADIHLINSIIQNEDIVDHYSPNHSPSKVNESNCNKIKNHLIHSNNIDEDEQFRMINSSSSSRIPNGSISSPLTTMKKDLDNKDNYKDCSNDDLFEIGSVVEVNINSKSYHGVIRWLGFLKNDSDFKIDSIRKSYSYFKNVIAGIELEEEIAGLTDGTLNGRRYFTCPMNKAYFVSLEECSKDSRFLNRSNSLDINVQKFDDYSTNSKKQDSSLFGSIDCPTVLGDIPPLNSNDLIRLCGKNRGIQGHHNSCYLDATLFAMFAFTTIFESLLNRPKRPDDIPEYNEVQRILKEEIVNPLRSNLYVRADRVMHLRQLLEKISSMRGLTSEEKDPEEFINLLLTEILKTDPFLKLSSGLESLFYQLFVEKDETLQLPNVQQLFDQSFLVSDIKLREVPSCLIIQMPRFGRDFKMYPKIIPSLYLDITNVLDNSPRECIVCGLLAEVECKECFGKFGDGLDSITFCRICLEKTHGQHRKRIKHKFQKLKIPPEFAMLKNHTNIPRVMMELFAILCIETSHYVSFVKCGTEPNSPWCFFDSMADRKGEQNGYNIPEVLAFSDFKWWLSKEGYNHLLNIKDEKLIPELPRRLLSDSYICFYSSEVLRYR